MPPSAETNGASSVLLDDWARLLRATLSRSFVNCLEEANLAHDDPGSGKGEDYEHHRHRRRCFEVTEAEGEVVADLVETPGCRPIRDLVEDHGQGDVPRKRDLPAAVNLCGAHDFIGDILERAVGDHDPATDRRPQEHQRKYVEVVLSDNHVLQRVPAKETEDRAERTRLWVKHEQPNEDYDRSRD